MHTSYDALFTYLFRTISGPVAMSTASALPIKPWMNICVEIVNCLKQVILILLFVLVLVLVLVFIEER